MEGIATVVTSKLVLKLVLGFFFGVLVYILGRENLNAFGIVTTLAAMDFIAAMYILHVKGNRFTSEKFPNKFIDLVKYAFVIGTMHLFAVIAPHMGLLVDTAIMVCAATEGISILEHMAELGVKIPLPILNTLRKEQAGEKK